MNWKNNIQIYSLFGIKSNKPEVYVADNLEFFLLNYKPVMVFFLNLARYSYEY